MTTVTVDTGGTVDANGTLEANIDIEEAATQAPGAAVVSYEGPNSGSGEYDVYQRIVTDDTAQAVSTSWGLCEPSTDPSFMTALGTLLAQAAAQGQTVVAASGDNGSEDCFAAGTGSSALSVDAPADDPNVTGVGGTYLLGAGGAANEPAWNDCQGESSYAQCTTDLGGTGGGGGGGLSTHFAKPSWQPVAAASTCATCRQVPDVAANAGIGEVFRSDGVYVAIGGTSIAAPKIAAIIADVNVACTARVGDLAPKLETLAAGNGYGTALNDVTSGNNDLARVERGCVPGRRADRSRQRCRHPDRDGLVVPSGPFTQHGERGRRHQRDDHGVRTRRRVHQVRERLGHRDRSRRHIGDRHRSRRYGHGGGEGHQRDRNRHPRRELHLSGSDDHHHTPAESDAHSR